MPMLYNIFIYINICADLFDTIISVLQTSVLTYDANLPTARIYGWDLRSCVSHHDFRGLLQARIQNEWNVTLGFHSDWSKLLVGNLVEHFWWKADLC